LSEKAADPYHDQLPTNLQWEDLNHDPLLVDRNKFTPLESVAFDYITLIKSQIEDGLELNEEPISNDRIEVAYTRPDTRRNLLTPTQITFGSEYNYDGEYQDLLIFGATLSFELADIAIHIYIKTESFPSLEYDDEKEEIFTFIELAIETDGNPIITNDTGKDSRDIDPETIKVLRGTHDKLKSLIETGEYRLGII